MSRVHKSPSPSSSARPKCFTTVVLGAGGVGKSALAVRFVKDIFNETYNPTIEETYHRDLILDGERYSLDVLDTAGADQFAVSSNESYIRSGHGFILVFSLTFESSLRDLENIRQQIVQIKGNNTYTPIVVVGAKLDLIHEREVSKDAIRQKKEEWNLPFYETSAKHNWHVADAFQDLVTQMRERYKNEVTTGYDPKGKGKKRRDHCTIA